MDDAIKKDWRNGFISFCLIGLGMMLAQNLPTGETLLNAFLGIFGLTSQWVRGGSTTYIGNIVIFIGIIVCIVYAVRFWRGYGVRFAALPQILRKLPLLVALFVIIMGNFIGTMTPSPIDRIYFWHMSRQSGIEAFTFAVHQPLTITTRDGVATYRYSFWLTNHGHDAPEIHIYLIYDTWIFDGNTHRRTTSQTRILWQDGSYVYWAGYLPRSDRIISGDFPMAADDNIGSASISDFSVLIVDEDGNQFAPPVLIRQPHFIR